MSTILSNCISWAWAWEAKTSTPGRRHCLRHHMVGGTIDGWNMLKPWFLPWNTSNSRDFLSLRPPKAAGQGPKVPTFAVPKVQMKHLSPATGHLTSNIAPRDIEPPNISTKSGRLNHERLGLGYLTDPKKKGVLNGWTWLNMVQHGSTWLNQQNGW